MAAQLWGGKIGIAIVLWIVLALRPAAGFGQQTVVQGIVADGGGNPLKGVKVTFVDKASGSKFSVMTKKDGKFVKIGLPPSAYSATFETDGYFPYSMDLRLGMDDQKAIKVSLQKIPPKIEDDKDLAEGVDLYQQGRYPEAIEVFKRLIEKFPKNPAAFAYLGVAYLRNKDCDLAIASLVRAIDLKPDMAHAYLALGESYLMKNDLDKAVESIERALKIQPEDARTHYDLGLLYYKTDRMDDAIAAFEKAVSLEPKLSSAFYQLGLAHIKKGDYKKSIRYFEEFLSLQPQSPEASQIRATIEELKKKIEKGGPGI